MNAAARAQRPDRRRTEAPLAPPSSRSEPNFSALAMSGTASPLPASPTIIQGLPHQHRPRPALEEGPRRKYDLVTCAPLVTAAGKRLERGTGTSVGGKGTRFVWEA